MSLRNKIKLLLLPISWVYGIIIFFRNLLFDTGLIKSESYDIPVITVGNITVGGTGKTPHTEYLVRLLSENYRVAVLSRGYQRKTKGFLLADTDSGVADLGDESYQMKRKFPSLLVAVDEKRRRGISLLSENGAAQETDVIILDDAYQHRHVKPAISILLIDYNRLINEDYLLPAGNLREPASQSKRANILIITKCPSDLKPIELRILVNKFDLYPQQTIYCSTIVYGKLKKLSYSKDLSETEDSPLVLKAENDTISGLNTLEDVKNNNIPVLIVAGIAAPETFVRHIHNYCPNAQTMLFSDHHEFGKKDIIRINNQFEKIKQASGIIITTEKDSMRMIQNDLFKELAAYTYYPEITISFLDNQGQTFNNKIIDYVRINKRNS